MSIISPPPHRTIYYRVVRRFLFLLPEVTRGKSPERRHGHFLTAEKLPRLKVARFNCSNTIK